MIHTEIAGGAFHAPVQSCFGIYPLRRPAAGHRKAGGGTGERPAPAGAAGRHRQRQDLHHGQGHREGAAPHAGAGPQQDAGGPTVRGVPGVLPGKRRGVLRLLLRLLSAGGVHPPHGYLHREGRRHQRRDRAPAPQRHGSPLRAAGRHRGGVGVLHLRLGGSHRLRQHGHLPAAGEGVPTGSAAAEAGGDPLRPQRRGLRAQYVPGPGGHSGDLPGVRQRLRHPGGVLRGRDRPHLGDQPRHRSGPAGAAARGHLPRQPLRHHQGEDGAGGAGDRAGAGGAQGLLRGSRQAH